jgi:hypothetical protein
MSKLNFQKWNADNIEPQIYIHEPSENWIFQEMFIQNINSQKMISNANKFNEKSQSQLII